MRNFDGLKVLAVSPIGHNNGNNTSVHRVKALKSLNCSVQVIDSAVTDSSSLRMMRYRIQARLFRFGFSVSLPDFISDNTRLLAMVKQASWDVIWLEKALTINHHSLKKVRQYCPNAKIIGFSPDDMNGRHNQSQQFLEALPFYDYFLTTKSYNVEELSNLGCPKVIFVGNGFDPDTFKPLPVTDDDRLRLGGDIGFIGHYEHEREDILRYLADNQLNVRVWGGGWEKTKSQNSNLRIEMRHLWGDEYAKACSAFKINLGFLRKINRDQQTTRSVEIPACRGFLLAERTKEHQDLFEEGVEADFFSSHQELLDKCKRYLQDERKRLEVANQGYNRCFSSGYSNAARLEQALSVVFE